MLKTSSPGNITRTKLL